MSEIWMYILLGFFAGMIFCFLLIVSIIGKIIRIMRKNGEE